RRRPLAGETPTELATCPIDRAAIDTTIGSREVHVLEHAAVLLPTTERMRRVHAGDVDGNDLAWLDIPLVGRADDIQGAARRREDGALVLEVASQLCGVHEVSVVGQGDVPALGSRNDGLRILDRG